VQFANGPDGALYVIDMYREIIEHPWSLPDNIKKFLDLNSGNNRGRIYRIVPDGFKRPKQPQLGKASTAELVATLENPNGWHRDTASRLLYERQDKSAVPLLADLLSGSKFPLARLHGLHSLDGLGELSEARVLQALADSDEIVREHAIKLSEKFFNRRALSETLVGKLRSLANDPSLRVRYQLAFTLGPIAGFAPLAEIAKRDIDSSWTQAAILSSLATGAAELFKIVSADASIRDSKSGQAFLQQLAQLIGANNKKEEVAQILEFINQANQPDISFALVRALSDGLQRIGKSLPIESGNLKEILSAAKKTAIDLKAAEATRVQAVHVLGVDSFAESGPTLLSMLDLQQPQSIQLSALSTLARFNDSAVGLELTKRWNSMTPRLRSEAITVLLARPDRVTALLKAVESGAIRATDLTTPQTKFVRAHSDKSVRQLAAKVLSTPPASTRQQVVDSFLPAIDLKGDLVHGKKIYQDRCISCHRLGGEGHALGPDLVTVKNSGKEKMLVNILDPNREVRPDYMSYVVETKDDESYIGLVANETATTVTIRQAYGKENIINRSNIKKMQSQGQSLMPEGLEAGLKPQDLADLMEYIETAPN
jgi:putative heme-binding domain-containing protein